MNFKESFKRYQLGEASEKEIEYIEAELEKNELIQDYLAESVSLDLDFDIDLLGFDDEFISEINEEFDNNNNADDFKEVDESEMDNLCPKCGFEFD